VSDGSTELVTADARLNLTPGFVEASSPRKRAKPEKTNDEVFLRLAQTRFRTAADTESKMRVEMLTDQKFMASEQWPDTVRTDRDLDGRPCLTVNRLPNFKRQVTNQQRQAKPAIQISPIDNSDTATAEVFQGVIRHIETQSYADIAYDTACDQQVTIGRGYFRLVVDWDKQEPWQQDIRIKRIRNPFCVYFDPSCQEFDYSDARYCFIIEDIPKDEYTARYGAETMRSLENFASIGDRAPDWMPEGRCRIAEYFYVEEWTEERALLSTGEEVAAEELTSDEMKEFMQLANVHLLRKRLVQKRQVRWAKIDGAQVLERGDWAGSWIPVIPVLGDELDINGQVDYRGMVRDARDPQRMYNYWVSAETETIALAPKSPWVGAEGQFEGHEAQWKLANKRNFPYLQYKIKSVGDTPLPAPQRQTLEPPIQAIVMATQQADNDLKAVIGYYDASLGKEGPESSGKAIIARQRQGDMSNSHWIDNLVRAMRTLGRLLVDLIPKVYDAPRVLRIIGADNQPKTVIVHAGQPADSLPQKNEMKGIDGIYDLGAGRFDIVVSVGPSFHSRRQEAVEAMTAFMNAYPPVAPVIGDLLAESMDWPGANLVAKRLRKMVPPQFMEEEGEDADLPPAVQAKLQQAKQAVLEMQKQLEEAVKVIQTKQVENQGREKIVAMQEQTKLQLAEMNAQITAQEAQLNASLKLQTDAQAGQLKLQGESQRAQLKAQTDGQSAQLKAQTERVSQEGQLQVDAQRMQLEHERGLVELQMEREQQASELEFEAARTRLQTQAEAQRSVVEQRAQAADAASGRMLELERLRAEFEFKAKLQEDQQLHELAVEQLKQEHALAMEQAEAKHAKELESVRVRARRPAK
jgi:hypothetical protein